MPDERYEGDNKDSRRRNPVAPSSLLANANTNQES